MCSADFAYGNESTIQSLSCELLLIHGKLMGFRIKVFTKQFVCFLFPVCLRLVEKMIAGIQVLLTCMRFILLVTRITSGKMSVNFIQFLLSSSATGINSI